MQTVAGIAWRQFYFFLLKCLTDRGSIRRPDDVFPLQEGTPNIRPLMLLIFAVFMGCLLTKATLSHLVILTLFYIPVSGQLHPLSYTISYLWPENLLPGWNMIYVIKIFFNAKTQKNYFILTVQNSSSGNVLENNPDLKTTKSNPSYHGYGIRLIRQIAEKYNGATDFSATKESFICRVMLERV